MSLATSIVSSIVYAIASWVLLLRPGALRAFLPLLMYLQRRGTGAISQAELDEVVTNLIGEERIQLPTRTGFRKEHALRLGAIIGELRSAQSSGAENSHLGAIMKEAADLLHVEESAVSFTLLDELERRIRTQLAEGAFREERATFFLNILFFIAALGVAVTAWPAFSLIAKKLPWLLALVNQLRAPVLIYVALNLVCAGRVAPAVVPRFLGRLLAFLGSLLAYGLVQYELSSGGKLSFFGLHYDFGPGDPSSEGLLTALHLILQAVALLPLALAYDLELLGVGFASALYFSLFTLLELVRRNKALMDRDSLDMFPLVSLTFIGIKYIIKYVVTISRFKDKRLELQASVFNLGLNLHGLIGFNLWALVEYGVSESPHGPWRFAVYIILMLIQIGVGIVVKERSLYLTSATFFAIWGITQVLDWSDANVLIVFVLSTVALMIILWLRKRPEVAARFASALFRE